MATHGLPAWPWTDSVTEDLPPAEALLLEGLRRWAGAARQGQPPLPAMRAPFVAEDVPEAAEMLDALLRCLAKVRPLAIGCLPCPHLVGDEPALVLACALAQRGARPEGLAAFSRLLPPMQAYAAMGHAVMLGCRLRRAGLLLAALPRR
jgi:hypothetical protein